MRFERHVYFNCNKASADALFFPPVCDVWSEDFQFLLVSVKVTCPSLEVCDCVSVSVQSPNNNLGIYSILWYCCFAILCQLPLISTSQVITYQLPFVTSYLLHLIETRATFIHVPIKTKLSLKSVLRSSFYYLWYRHFFSFARFYSCFLSISLLF